MQPVRAALACVASWRCHTRRVVYVGLLTVTLVLPRVHHTVVNLAAKSAAVLITEQAWTNYHALSYVLWFVPLVLVVSLARGNMPTSRSSLATGAL